MKKEWRNREPARAFLEIAGTWLWLLGLMIAATLVPSLWFRLGCFVLISTRQYALMILMHEAFHGLLFESRRRNDGAGRWLLAYPLGSVYDVAKEKHLRHHRELGEPSDPDFPFYRTEDKATVASLLRHFFVSLIFRQIFYTFARPKSPGKRAASSALPKVAFVQLFLFLPLAISGHWHLYFLLWVLPIATLTILWDKLRAFCEHVPLEGRALTRTFVPSAVERFFLSPFDMNYHAEHHRFPTVPHYRLSTVMKEAKLGDPAKSYLGFLLSYAKEQHRKSHYPMQSVSQH